MSDRPSICVGRRTLCVLTAVLGVSVGHAQFHSADYRAKEAAEARAKTEHERRRQLQAAYEARRARAHRRLASTAGLVEPPELCPARPGTGIATRTSAKPIPHLIVPRSALRPVKPRWSDMAPSAGSASGLFAEHISEQVVQAKCINCHVDGGVSGHTRLVLSPSTADGHESLNLAVFEDLVASGEDAADLILNKIQGVGHGGGIQVPAGSADFANMERFLRLLSGENSPGSGLSPETLFDGVTMASPAKTLRRAALIFAGRLPTQAELNSVSDGEDSSLRKAIRNLLTGPGFHEFLTRASNDRLLTDRDKWKVIDIDQPEFFELNKEHARVAETAIGRGHDSPWRDPEYWKWTTALQYGFVRSPLELVAHVVENDLPYTEVLTADYIMANPLAARGYGAATEFENADDFLEFKPSKMVSYFRNDESKLVEDDPQIGRRVLNPGNLATQIPHTGILNTTVFLRRYPTTATNRNRARSRWTYYHFLGLDIEKSASRTTDPDALADTDNPTMKNPACTVCHSALDPVAGTFQNYSDLGLYRKGWGGMDSLPELYKHPEDGSVSPYQEGDTWFRDMREPGFGDAVAPSADNSVQWLASQIANDPRFAEATVKFWWQPIMGTEIADPPEERTDPEFEARLVAATAQAAEVSRLGEAFRQGIAGGRPYSGKDLLAEIALSPWFRAESVTGENPIRNAALRDVGVERLLTPEELDRKTEAISGYVWGRGRVRLSASGSGLVQTNLSNFYQWRNFGLLYGGIDSDGLTTRVGEITPLMAAVSQSHAAEVSCPIVRREFFLWQPEERRLFDGIDKYDTPISEAASEFEVTGESWQTRQSFSISVRLGAGTKQISLAFTNDFFDEENDRDRNLYLDGIQVRANNGNVVAEIELESMEVKQHCGENRRDLNSYKMWSNCSLTLDLEIPVTGVYAIEISAFQDRVGDDPARVAVAVESDESTSRGAMAIRRKLVGLHDKLFGLTVSVDSPEIDSAFNLFAEVWRRKRRTEGLSFWDSSFNCRLSGDYLYYQGFADDAVYHDEWGNPKLKWDHVDALFDELDMTDPHHTVRTWVVTLAYLLMDYRYLYL